jgi:hypothetical protein
MPSVNELREPSATSESSDTIHPERLDLLLPSAIKPALRTTRCLEGLPDKERRLRVAQAEDAISELRRLLRVKMGLWDFKATQVGASQ